MWRILVVIAILALLYMPRILRIKKQSAANKAKMQAMEQEMGRLNYIVQQKTQLEQQLKLVPFLLFMGIALLITGLVLTNTGWRGVGTVYVFAILIIAVGVGMKVGGPKKIEEIEEEIQVLRRKENER